jgi:hypothetical protein
MQQLKQQLAKEYIHWVETREGRMLHLSSEYLTIEMLTVDNCETTAVEMTPKCELPRVS